MRRSRGDQYQLRAKSLYIDAADLVRFVRQKVAGQVFKEGQTLVLLYDPYGVGDSCILPCADTRIIETLELVAAERTCDAVACELDWWTLVGRLAALAGRWACRPLKFALVTVFAAYVAGWVERYVLPILRFFSQIPW